MTSFAHVGYPNQHHLMVRAKPLFTIERLDRLARRIVALLGHTFQRWAAAHRQAVQDRMFWELALTDSRVMAELHAIQAHAELNGSGQGN